MTDPYHFLKTFLPPHTEDETTPHNWFYPVTDAEIKVAEKTLGRPFPPELRAFYRAIGYGSLTVPHESVKADENNAANYLLPPEIAAGLYKPFEDSIPQTSEGYVISADTYEDLEPGDLPIFEISDGDQFLVMRPNSSTPNAVWSDTGIKIETSFAKFIWRLYYENLTFYNDVTENT